MADQVKEFSDGLPVELGCMCSMHMLQRIAAPSGMGGGTGPVDNGPAPNFLNGTSPDISHHVKAGDHNTRDLYEFAGAGQLTIVQGGTVITMDGTTVLPDHDIVIRDGKIVGIQATGESFNNAIIVDAKGRYIIPGLADMHSHCTVANIAAMWAPVMGEGVTADDMTLPYDLMMFLYLAAGITRTQIMAGLPEYLALREEIKAGRIVGPHMRIASPVIDGYPPFWAQDITLIVGDADGARQAAAHIAEAGYDFAKPYTLLTNANYKAFAAECQALGIEMTGHLPKSVTVEEAFEAGQRGVAHVFEYFANPDDPDRFDLDTMQARAKLSKEFDVTAHTTLSVSIALEYDVGLRPGGVDPSAYLDPVMRYLMDERSPLLQGWRADPALVQQGVDNVLHSLQVTQALYAEGVRIVTGTDIPSPNGTGRQSLHEEFQFMTRDVGMSAVDVLKASTVAAAEHAGELASSGTIEVGKGADLVVLDRDPTKDITATAEIATVIAGTAVLRKEAIATGMARVRKVYDAMPAATYPD